MFGAVVIGVYGGSVVSVGVGVWALLLYRPYICTCYMYNYVCMYR